jgi:murein DD-endopeptidase MepM/ murein hydrolase activator NlpD
MTHGEHGRFNYLMVTLALLLGACGSFGQVASDENRTIVDREVKMPTPTEPTDLHSDATLSSITPFSVTQVDSPMLPPSEVLIPTGDAKKTVSPAETAEIHYQICSPLALHPLEELREIISDPYRPPPPGKEERHHGIDFSYYRHGERLSIQGVGIQSVLPGKVAASLVDSYPYGNVVIIETAYAALPNQITGLLPIKEGQSIYTLYAHMDQTPLVPLGEVITACRALGLVGKSGNAVEPHLHLEMRVGPSEAVFTSMGYYRAQDTEEERRNYVRWRTGGEFLHFNPMLVLQDLVEALRQNK